MADDVDDPYELSEPLTSAMATHAASRRWSSPSCPVCMLIDRSESIRAEYQRFYDFVAEADTAIVDAWHFTENARRARGR